MTENKYDLEIKVEQEDLVLISKLQEHYKDRFGMPFKVTPIITRAIRELAKKEGIKVND